MTASIYLVKDRSAALIHMRVLKQSPLYWRAIMKVSLKTLQTGGLEWMTAGSGIVHTEEINKKVKMRILQLWLVLPKEQEMGYTQMAGITPP
jgi:hypothetical protein